MSAHDSHGPRRVGVFRLSGDIDIASAPAMLEELVMHADAATVNDSRLVIDCSALTFIDSTGLSALEAASKKTGKRLVLIAVPDVCRRVFEVTGLDRVFEIVD